MNPNLLDGIIVAASVGLWFAGYALALLLTRPVTPDAAPATQDLGTEPPAVVSLLAGGWELTEDAAESTLLDLAARRYLEFRQPAGDPLHTTIHIREATELTQHRSGLTRYESRVFDRVAALAVGGVLPLTALTFRNDGEAKSWYKLIKAEVVADARARGLSRRRFSPAVLSALGMLAIIAAVGVAVAAWRIALRTDEDDPVSFVFGAGVITFGILGAIGARSVGERDTPAGREVAARWLGVRDWLRGHEAFADLPPSAVAVWDRYLAYGAALGTTRVASAVIELGMGNRKRVWSSFGGAWHRVRVRYPRLWSRYGKTAPRLFFRAALALALGYALVRFWRDAVGNLIDIPEIGANPVASAADPVSTVGFALGLFFLAYGGYFVARTIVDLAAPVTLTGQVLWQEVWRSTSGGDDRPPQPWLHYLAVDDGRGDRTTAWGLPQQYAGQCHDGDTVTVTGRRWSRRVTALTVVERGSAGRAVTATAGAEQTENLILTAMGQQPTGLGQALGAIGRVTMADAFRGAPTGSADLLTADEVGRALGVRIRPVGPPPAAGPVVLTEFKADDGTTALLLMVSGGLAAKLAMRARRRYPALPGVGDEAHLGDDWAMARRGDTVVMLTTRGLGRQADSGGLHWLLSQAIGRLPAPVG